MFSFSIILKEINKSYPKMIAVWIFVVVLLDFVFYILLFNSLVRYTQPSGGN